jgi:MFS transporter, DHA2 family, multidrug resistance protein
MNSESVVPQPWRPSHNPWLIALTVTLATFMEILDTSIANVSLPHIAGNLSAGVDESTWVLTSYLVANAIILPISGWFSSLIGRKNYYMASVALFTVSSFLCGFAPSLGWLLFFRVLQGLGGGGLQPSEQSILADTFPTEKLGMAMALYGFAVVTAPVIGPTLGGWITDNYSWRWIFFINIPVGLLSLYLTSRMVEDPPTLTRRSLKTSKIDGVGLSAIALGLASLQIMLDKGQREDWFSSHLIVTLAFLTVLGLGFAIFWELREKDPIIDIRLLGERNFFFSNVLMFVLGLILYGSTALLPIFLQTLMGYSATTAGMVLSPGGIVTMISMPLVGFLIAKIQPRYLIGFGLLVVGSSLVLMGGFDLQIDFRTAMLARVLQMAGVGFLWVPINAAAYAFLKPEKSTQASGFLNLSRNVGGGVGIALATTFQARSAQSYQAILSAHMTTLNPAYRSALAQTAQNLIAQGLNAARAAALAPALLYQQLGSQAGMLGYRDDFRFMALVCFVSLGLLFFLKKSQRQQAKVPIH